MRVRFSAGTAVFLVCLCVLAAASSSSAQPSEEDYFRAITKTEFVTGIYAALIGQVRTMVDPAEALVALQDRGLIPEEWNGEETITLGEADEVFNHMGIQVFHEDPDLLLTSSLFEQILRTHEGEIKRMKHHWDIIHGFSMGLELGEYRGRILSAADF